MDSVEDLAAEVGAARQRRMSSGVHGCPFAAAELIADLPDLRDVRTDEVAEVLLPRFVAVGEEEGPLPARLRAAMSSRSDRERLRHPGGARLVAITADQRVSVSVTADIAVRLPGTSMRQ